MVKGQKKIGGEVAVTGTISHAFEEFYSRGEKKNRVVAEA